MSKRANKISQIPTLDLSYSRAATILARQYRDDDLITIVLVGCGGTGSYMAQHIGRLLRALSDSGRRARALFVDPDRVERKNIGRQLFCEAELGANKAEALALRYGSAWGVPIGHVAERLVASQLATNEGLTVLVGCVDNAAGRKEISATLGRNGPHPDQPPDIWWLDCGNHEETGQVLLGSAVSTDQLRNAFPSARICQALPSPALQSPELLVAKRAETKASKMSCAERTAANLQSLNINGRIAGEAADMLTRLLLTRDLKRFRCELNLAAGSMRSTYATPEAVATYRGGR